MRYLFAVVLSYMVSCPVYAEVSDRVVLSFGIGAGYPISVEPTSFNQGRQFRSGVHIGGGLGYILDQRQKFIVSSSVDYTNYSIEVIEGNTVRFDQSAEIVSLFTDLKLRLRSVGAIVIPYVKGGAGLFRTMREDRIRGQSEIQNRLGFGLDAGIDLALSERAGFFAEAQYQVGLTDQKMTQHMPFKVGIFMR